MPDLARLVDDLSALSVIEAAPASEAAREVALLAKAIVGPLAQWAVA